MLNALRKALAGIAVLVLLPVEIVVRGVRTVMSVLMPQRNTGLLDAAQDVLDEEPAAEPAAMTDAQLAAKRASLQLSEGQRVRLAARALVANTLVEKRLLDPSKGRDAQLLEWLGVLQPSQLQVLATADPDRIGRHLEGVRTLTLPTLSDAVELRESAQALKEPALTRSEWQAVLRKRAEDKERPGYSEKKLERSAATLARLGWNMEHARRHAKAKFSDERSAA